MAQPLPPRRRKSKNPRPAPSPGYSSFSITHKDFNTEAHISPGDGRVHISVNAFNNGNLPGMLSGLNKAEMENVVVETEEEGKAREEKEEHEKNLPKPPRLCIVVMIIGSRGDVQPFIPISKLLMEKGHRVRLATHGAFKEFVEGFGIEFFDVGGDPSELMAFMVKNPGLVPGLEAIKEGEIARRREQMYHMFKGFWRACIDENGATNEPFIADAIIANPPSFAHVHCAEKLGIPLHLMFTFPYSPTQAIPHPLAFIQNSNLGSDYTNAITYPMVEMMTWQGLGDLVNRFRQKTLFLEPVATLWAPGMISRLKVPYTYMWSPALIPKPKDWGDHIDVTGFVFLDQCDDFTPPPELEQFLAAGPPPVYIGFGSIVVDDPDGLTTTIFEAVKKAGVRALVAKGWGGLGGESDVPENIFMLGTTPHDWLFSHVSAVVHHGGAGTTAIGLFHGRPTMVVPFFGDQTFWGAMIHNADAGPAPVPHKELTVEKLVEGIRILLDEKTQKAAGEISRKIREEDGDGAANAVQSFFNGLAKLDSKGKRGLGYRGMTYGEGGPMGPGEGKWGTGGPGIHCDILNERVAVWRVRKTRVRLSAMAASWLVEKGLLGWEDLRLVRHTEWNDFDGPGEPLSGGFSAFVGALAGVAKGIFGVPASIVKGAKRIDDEEVLKPKKARRGLRRHRRKKDEDEDGWSTISSIRSRERHKRSIPREVAHGTKKSIMRIGKATAHAPMDVGLAVAQGFHNAPRLYGDEVRHPPRITGFQSGMAAAGKEFALGIYDGFTGLVTQPYRGAKEEGVKGALKGAGRGLGGLFFKTQAGFAGVIGFSLKGVHREARKGRDRAVLDRVMEARRRQGAYQLQTQSEERLEERMQEGWKTILEEREKHTEREKSLGKEIAALKVRKRERTPRHSSDQARPEPNGHAVDADQPVPSRPPQAAETMETLKEDRRE